MAIEASYLNILLQIIKKAKENKKKPLKALCLAYPDLLVTRQFLENTYSESFIENLPIREDSKQIWSWHGLKECNHPIYDTEAFFNLQNIEIEVIDIVSSRGNERIVDLNNPLPEDLKNMFDLVIDTGTCEHCFNVGQAFLNSCEALKVGGYLVHAAPLNKCNHGFWNFCPTVYPDFLGDNGFKIVHLTGAAGNLSEGIKYFELDPFNRVLLPNESVIYVVAQRLKNQTMIWPTQRKYRKLISNS